jgi:pimeloyl-ACP methyl ester carboxylesterase
VLHANDCERFTARGLRRLLVIAVAVLAAAACSNSNDEGTGDAGNGDGGGASFERGVLVQSPPALVAKISAGDLLADSGDPLQQALLLQAGSPVCDVVIHRIEYTAVGGANEETRATGALMVPSGTATECSGARPIMLYARGTRTDKNSDISNLQSSDENPEGFFLAAFFAAHGYIVVAPNYAGYAGSPLPYHPYLNGEQQSKDMLDALKAARSALPTPDAPDTRESDGLYVAGYSQGGYVALATQRALEANGTPVDAVAPMSGPYALTAFADAVFSGRVNGGAPIFTTLLLTSYQRSFGGIYGSVNDVYADEYADGIETLLPSTRIRSQIYADGDLPSNALFSSEPPEPAYADITPATEPQDLATVFERGFANEHYLLRNSFRLAYLQDMQANPDGAWPTATTGAPPGNPTLPFRKALQQNDLRSFSPKTPTLLCGGHEDPVVFWLNTEALQTYWQNTAPPSTPFTVLDVDAATSNDDPYEDVKRRFAVAKDVVRATAVAQGADDGGDEAVLEVYHGGLVAPFCMEAARDFFDAH